MKIEDKYVEIDDKICGNELKSVKIKIDVKFRKREQHPGFQRGPPP